MIVNQKQTAVILEENEVDWLWDKLLKKFISNTQYKLNPTKVLTPAEFWRNTSHRINFYNNFILKTSFKNSGILLVNAKDDDKKNAENDKKKEKEGEKNISEVYLRNHLITRKEKSFQNEYLNRMIFYITEDKADAEWSDYFERHEIKISEPTDSKKNLPQGVKYLNGYWISFNRNIDAGNYAQCFYHFHIVGNEMHITREGYSSETIYNGKVIIQGDSSYLFELVGETRGLKKFVIADEGKIKPDILTCLSSAFGIHNNQPILAKEILIKLPDIFQPTLKGGVIIRFEDLEKNIGKYYQNEEKTKILEEIKAFLGETEVPYFSLEDLKSIKKSHLKKIETDKIAEPKVIKKTSVYVHFNRLSTNNNSYIRNVIKYFNKEDLTIDFIDKAITVTDEYTYLKICQYTKDEVQKHRVSYEVKDGDGVVDIQSLFPIVNDDFDNDLNMPSMKYSNLVMDAMTDTFVSTATFINDFSKSKSIALVFDEKTLSSEIIIDFSSIEDFAKLNIGIDRFSYHFNEPDEIGKKRIPFRPKDANFKGATLNSIDREKLNISMDENISIDPKNPKIFAIKIDFPSMKDEILYIHFNLNIESERK